MPAWLPDGSGFLFSRERLDRADRDRCLALMPADGAPIRGELCNRAVAAADSVDVYEAPAAAADGRLAYVQANSPRVPRSVTPRSQALVLARLDGGGDARVLLSIPYPGPSGRAHEGISQLRWLGPDALVYLAERVAYERLCGLCLLDTLRWGLEIVRLDLATPVPAATMLPGSDQASSVAVAGGDTVYYTLNGDSRVLRYVLSRDSIAIVHDFGPTGIARDVQVAAGRLVAVVGGVVSFGVDPVFGPIQRDFGGALLLVDLATGAETILSDSTMALRRPALAPDGRTVVAERVVGRAFDLWLWERP
ncbi:MAG: hypothetical protein ACREMR_05060 [Gemmatimonadales bacterium]